MKHRSVVLDNPWQMWYTVNAETNGDGAFCFRHHSAIEYCGQSAFCKGIHVPPFVSATVANLTGGVLSWLSVTAARGKAAW